MHFIVVSFEPLLKGEIKFANFFHFYECENSFANYKIILEIFPLFGNYSLTSFTIARPCVYILPPARARALGAGSSPGGRYCVGSSR
jgi:hypothetical protein